MYRNMYAVLFVFCMVLAGCQSALLGTIRENKEREQRIIEKQWELEELHGQNQISAEEHERLLGEKELLEAALDAERERLATIDAELKSLEAKGVKSKKHVSSRIRRRKKDIDALKSSVRSKEKKLEQLKKQSELYLEMGLEE